MTVTRLLTAPPGMTVGDDRNPWEDPNQVTRTLGRTLTRLLTIVGDRRPPLATAPPRSSTRIAQPAGATSVSVRSHLGMTVTRLLTAPPGMTVGDGMTRDDWDGDDRNLGMTVTRLLTAPPGMTVGDDRWMGVTRLLTLALSRATAQPPRESITASSAPEHPTSGRSPSRRIVTKSPGMTVTRG
jgi:hypothetical protein